jgi:uncharacterized protein
MKYVVAIAIVFVIIWLIRASGRREARDAERSAARPPPTAAALPQDMVECPVCHVHLPRGEALPGPDGKLFCCAEHRLRADR